MAIGNAINSRVYDSVFNAVNASDTTKQFKFSLSGATTGFSTTFSFVHTSNRTLTFPDLTDTVISRISTDQGANRVKNKDLDAGNVLFVDATDTTKKFAFAASGATTGTTLTLSHTLSVNRTFTFTDNASALVIPTAAAALAITNTPTVGYALVATGANAATWQSILSGTGGGLTWNDVTGTSQTATAGNGYVADNAALVTITLPAVPTFGDVVAVVGRGAGGWKVQLPAGSTATLGATSTTTAGSVNSTLASDTVKFVCVNAAAKEWRVFDGNVGNLDLL